MAEYLMHSKGLASRRVGDEEVIVSPRAGKVWSLNPAGALVWELADGSLEKAELAEALCELGNNIKTCRQIRSCIVVMPQWFYPLQQSAKSVLRVSVANWPESAKSKRCFPCDALKKPVMCKSMHVAAQLARKRMCIRQTDRTYVRISNVCKYLGAAKRLLFKKLHPVAVRGRSSVTKSADILFEVVSDSPAILVFAVIASMTGEFIERHADGGWLVACYCK